MNYDPYYDILALDEERRQRLIRQMEDSKADYEFVKLHLGRAMGWLGKKLVNLSERIQMQPEERTLPQG
jgi:hypothetical protein